MAIMVWLVAKWLIVALSFFLAAYLVPGIVVESFYTALILAFVWGVINLTVKPILTILTLPVSILTLGLFSFVINALLLWFLGTVIKGFEVDGFIAAFLGALIIAIAVWAGNVLLKSIR